MAKSAQIGNGFDEKLIKTFVGDIERHKQSIVDHMMRAVAGCKDWHEQIANVYDIAKDAGVPKKALKAVVKARELERKATAVREAFEDEEDQESFDQIRFALGDLIDLPLGVAAMKGFADVQEAGKDDAPAKAKRGRPANGAKSLRDEVAASIIKDNITWSKENTQRLQDGIKQLPDEERDADFDDATSAAPSRRGRVVGMPGAPVDAA